MKHSHRKAEKRDDINRLMDIISDMSDTERRALLKDLEAKGFRARRQYPRKPFMTVVDYVSRDRTYTDFIQNISAGGVFIETRIPFTVGQDLSLAFPLPKFNKQLKLCGKIVRTTDQGIGVKFRMADQEQEETIRELFELL